MRFDSKWNTGCFQPFDSSICPHQETLVARRRIDEFPPLHVQTAEEDGHKVPGIPEGEEPVGMGQQVSRISMAFSHGPQVCLHLCHQE